MKLLCDIFQRFSKNSVADDFLYFYGLLSPNISILSYLRQNIENSWNQIIIKYIYKQTIEDINDSLKA